jgi:hypothetical protein
MKILDAVKTVLMLAAIVVLYAVAGAYWWMGY